MLAELESSSGPSNVAKMGATLKIQHIAANLKVA